MPNIKKVEVSAKTITGLQIRTKNSDETHPLTQKIAPLWGKFFEEIMPTLDAGALVYGVYHHYESDDMGEFDILAGSDVLEKTAEMNTVTLEAGKYLMFPVKGEMPQAIIETWTKVWAYFEDPSIDERRAYETDFEHYISMDEAAIYIGVHYF